ncbi:ABC transporter permease [Clostridium sp. Marseille-QA1073]
MKALFISELERLWSKKSTWLIFIAIPLVLYASSKYYLSHNLSVPEISPEFTSFANFPSAAIQEQLIVFFNIVVVLLLVLSVTEEYRSGQIRMVMIRTRSFTQLFFAKFLAVATIILLLLITYYLLSIPIGYIFMPKLEKVQIFYYNGLSTIKESFLYGIKYYAMSYLTLIAMVSIIMFIAVISKTVTAGVGISMAFLLASMIYPQILLMFSPNMTERLFKFQLLSLTHIQHMGIAIMLGEHPTFVLYGFIVLITYTLIFTILSSAIFAKSDRYI